MTGRGRAQRGRGRLPPRQDPEEQPPPGTAGPPGVGAKTPQPGISPHYQPHPQQQAQPPPPQQAQVPPPQAQPPPQAEPATQPRGRGRGRGWSSAPPPPVPQGIPPASQPATGKPKLMLGVPRHLQQDPAFLEKQAQQVPAAHGHPQLASDVQAQELASQTRAGIGRAAFRGGPAAAGEPTDVARVTKKMGKIDFEAEKRKHFRLLRFLRYLDYDDVMTEPPISKVGSRGSPLQLITNYFKFTRAPDYTLTQYHVDYRPELESKSEKMKLLDQHARVLGPKRAFDGMILFSAIKLERSPMELCSKRENGEIITIIVTETCEVHNTSPTFIQVVNIQMRRALALLKLRQVGHHYFDADNPVDVPNEKLSVMPGFITAIKYHEGQLLLGLDVTHKVLRQETALDILRQMFKVHKCLSDAMKEDSRKALLGCTVLTRYNNRTYRIDDIDFDRNPRDTFSKSGQEISYMEYLKAHYNITVRDDKQPMLVSMPKAKDIRGGRAEMVYLVPEMCLMTGLTAEQRNDQHLMKAVSSQTRVNPDVRLQRLRVFRKQLCENTKTKELLDKWEMVPQGNLLETMGRVLDRQDIMMNDQRAPHAGRLLDFPKHRADWGNMIKNYQMSLSVSMDTWVVVFLKYDTNNAHEIVETLRKVGPGLGMVFNKPRMVHIERDSPDNFKNTISREVHSNLQMVMAVVPNQRKDRYDAIKKLCCVEKPCPSQVVVVKKRKDLLHSICTKIAIQMNCKVGGIPWTALMPFDDTMYIGIDTYHDSAHKRKSAVGFVASMDRNCSRFFSDCTIQDLAGEELANSLAPMVRVATTKYMEVNNGRKPLQYIIYRDGVGDGMLRMVNTYEKKQIIDAIMDLYKDETQAAKRPLVYIVVVKKRILTRLFTKQEKSPPPGTVVDKDVTTQYWFDFFMISQNVTQGTVSPVHYNCIEMPRVDTLCMSPDKMQVATYKLCHLYYNWPGTIRVPSVCMYAHKLAFLVGQSIHTSVSPHLCDRLFYL